jgi:superfamily II DNA/RNA helicase
MTTLADNSLIQSALASLHIDSLNDMQTASLAHASEDTNIVLLSPTGSGKTIAFLLPLLTIMKTENVGVQALVLAPSRELALQIAKVFTDMNTPWKCCCCYGGHAMGEENRALADAQTAVVIGTPGRILDHLDKGSLNAITIHTLVIDEFDKSLELGFQEEMANIVKRVPHVTRRVLASATDAEEIPHFVDMSHTVRLDFLDQNSEVRSRLKLMQVLSPEKDKIDTLFGLLCTLGDTSSIVFCNYRESVDRVSSLLDERHFPNERFHGGMEQADRERSLYKFRNGSTPVLVSTDLASRGLDIPSVEHIVHYHLPINEEAFVHRNGRTARWDTRGESFLILNGEEHLPEYIASDIPSFSIPSTLPPVPRPQWRTLYIGKGKKDKLSRGDVAGFIYKKGRLQREDVGAIDVREHASFVAIRSEKFKQLLQLVGGEKIKGLKTIMEEAK